MDFMAALDAPVSAIEKPKNLPQGTYVWNVTKVPSVGKTKKEDYHIIEFNVRAVSAEEDVDADELEEFGKASNAINRISFMASTAPDAENEVAKMLYDVKRFLLDTLQVDGDETSSIRELLAMAVNCQFMAQAFWKPQDNGDIYVNLRGYAPLP